MIGGNVGINQSPVCEVLYSFGQIHVAQKYATSRGSVVRLVFSELLLKQFSLAHVPRRNEIEQGNGNMRQLTFEGTGKAAWHDVPDAKILSEKQALVRPIVVGRCDLDVAFMRGIVPMKAGTPIGHEMIGEVIDVGTGVRNIRPGQKVIVPSQISCGECGPCKRGSTGRCENVPFAASYGMGRAGEYGSLVSDLVNVPFADAMSVPVPDNVDLVSLIAAADVAADAWRAVGRPLEQRAGASVLVAGGLAGSIGVYSAAIAASLSASTVYYVDSDPFRRKQAAKYNVRTAETLAELEGQQFDIVVDACGTSDVLTQAIRLTAPDGHFTSVVIHFGASTPVPLMEMYHKGITFVTGRPNCRANIEPVVACCAAGHFKPELVETAVYKMDEAPEAWMDPTMRVAAYDPALLDR